MTETSYQHWKQEVITTSFFKMLQDMVDRIEGILMDGHSILNNPYPDRELAKYLAQRDLLTSIIHAKGSDIVVGDMDET